MCLTYVKYHYDEIFIIIWYLIFFLLIDKKIDFVDTKWRKCSTCEGFIKWKSTISGPIWSKYSKMYIYIYIYYFALSFPWLDGNDTIKGWIKVVIVLIIRVNFTLSECSYNFSHIFSDAVRGKWIKRRKETWWDAILAVLLRKKSKMRLLSCFIYIVREKEQKKKVFHVLIMKVEIYFH